MCPEDGAALFLADAPLGLVSSVDDLHFEHVVDDNVRLFFSRRVDIFFVRFINCLFCFYAWTADSSEEKDRINKTGAMMMGLVIIVIMGDYRTVEYMPVIMLFSTLRGTAI